MLQKFTMFFARCSRPMTFFTCTSISSQKLRPILLVILGVFCAAAPSATASTRSTYIPYNSIEILGVTPTIAKLLVLDTAHQQTFTAWPNLDRVDVLSTADYHLIRSIPVPSPVVVDISPDGTTLAVGTSGGHVFFFSTTTYAKTNDIVMPDSGAGITNFVYTANGNAMINAVTIPFSVPISSVVVYWDHTANSFSNTPPGSSTAYNAPYGALGRSGDYSILLVGSQIVDGNTGAILASPNPMPISVNKDGSRYAACGNGLEILDSSFDVIYQDDDTCGGVFSADGQTFYREVTDDTGNYTQALDMTTFATLNIPNYFTARDETTGYMPTLWEAADATGMIYGLNFNDGVATIKNTFPETVWVAQDMAETSAAPAASNNLPTQTVPMLTGTSTIFPFATSPNFLVYDNQRQRLYAAHQNQVEVIDAVGKTVLTPLVPVSGIQANSQFTGMSISPDGNRLYIADSGTGMIHELNLNNPGTGYDLNLTTILGLSSMAAPTRVVELSSGQLLCSIADSSYGGELYLINPTEQSGQMVVADASSSPALVMNTTNGGEYATLSIGGNFDEGGAVPGIWNTDSSTVITQAGAAPYYLTEIAGNEDGTVIAVGNGNQSVYTTNPEILDFNQYALGPLDQHFGVVLPTGTPGLTLHPSGALLYTPGISAPDGFPADGGTSEVEIDDLHQWQPAGFVAFPDTFVLSNNPGTDHLFTIDSTGQYLFGVTKSGITMMVLNTVPLSIGNLQPASIQPQAGQTVTVRGSGFETGAVVTIGGSQADTTYVDADTLTVTTPALSSGYQDVTVTLPSGVTYTAPSLLLVEGDETAPVVTGFSPAAIPVEANSVGLYTAATVTVLGSGFGVNDMVEINGNIVASVFIDAGDIQATIPATLTGTVGSVSVAVISPDAGSSNTLALPMVNPVPVIESSIPLTALPNSEFCPHIVAPGLTSGSVLQLNGQNGTFTCVNTGSAGPASLTAFTPAPGGGTSNAINVDVSPAHPVLSLYTNNVVSSNPTVNSFPGSMNLGTTLINNSTTYTFELNNIGTGSYQFSSASITSGPFTLQSSTCPAIAPPPTSGNGCYLMVTFTPTDTTPATATLTINDNTAASPNIVTLTAVGSQLPAPTAVLNYINVQPGANSATIMGSAVLGGPSVPGTAWIEYGTDPNLTTFTQTPSFSMTGNGAIYDVGVGYPSLSNLATNTVYAARFAVQTAAGIGRSAIHLFSTATAIVQVTLAPSESNVVTTEPFQVAVAVDGGTGNPMASGTVILTGGNYTSAPVTLVKPNVGTAETATISVPGGSLTAGSYALLVTYVPDTAASMTYKNVSRIAWETVTQATPAVTVTPASSSISTLQALSVAVGVSGGSGVPTPTGTVILSGGGYTSAASTLGGGSATINIPAGALETGTDTLTVSYLPDSSSTSTYNSATGLTLETVNYPTPVIGAISPVFTSAGGAAFTLTINGSDFTTGSTVYWGSTALTTSFAGASQLTAPVTSGEIASSGITAITVQTPAPGGGTSNTMQFEVDSSSGSSYAPIFTSTTATISAGTTTTFPVTLSSSATDVSVTCLNLPAGASCSYSSTSALLTIVTTAATPPGTYQITVVFTETVPGSSSAFILLPILLFPLLFVRKTLAAKRAWFSVCLGLLLLAGASLVTSCGGGGSVGTTTPPPTQTVVSSAVVSLTIQ